MQEPKFKIGMDVRGALSLGITGTIVRIWPTLEDYYRDYGKRYSIPEDEWRKEMEDWYKCQAVKPSKGKNQFWYGIDPKFPKIEDISEDNFGGSLSAEEHLSEFDGIFSSLESFMGCKQFYEENRIKE